MLVIGLISGTSHDAIDCAAVEFGLDGETLRGALVATAARPYPARLRELLIAALPPAATDLETLCRLDTEIGQAFAAAAVDLIAQRGVGDAELICSHGQTVFHGVADGVVWGTMQLGQPAWIAERTGLPVVADLRARDVAAGGQGAPLVSILDLLLLSHEDGAAAGTTLAALNLGGIANATIIFPEPSRDPIAYDLGPANALIDAAAWQASDGRESFDRDGDGAARGEVDAALLARLLDDPYYVAPPPKTTGKEHFNDAYLRRRACGVSGAELLATTTAHAAEVVARGLRDHDAGRVLVSGGGARNPTLMRGLRQRLPGVVVESTEALGVPPDAKEAIAFALLGWLTAHGVAGTLSSATGARGPRLLGSITPGSGPLPTVPAITMPRRLTMRDDVSPSIP